MPKTPTAPAGLAAGGRKLWRSIVTEHDLAPAQLVQLTEACRAKDRLDQLDDPVLKQIRDEILNLDVNNLTPLEALNKLNDIKRILKG